MKFALNKPLSLQSKKDKLKKLVIRLQDIISTDMSSAFIQFDKPFYFAGDSISGHVYLYIVEPVNAREITVKFKGWETARWIEERVLLEHEKQNVQNNLIWHKDYRVHMESSDSEDGEGNDESMRFNYVKRGNQIIEIKRYHGERTISKFSHVLYSFGGSFIPPGQYSFPFVFKTGEEYPASFSDKSSDNHAKGRIKYEMQAFIRVSNRIRAIRTKSQVIIREIAPIRNEKQEMEAHVKSCCCCDQGTTRIRCFFQKNGYSPGEDAKMYCVLDNKEGKAVVERVSVSLKNEITYISRENHRRNRTITLFDNSFSGLQPGEEGERDQVVKILNQQNKMNPMDIKPTTSKGTCLKSTYYLQVEAVLSASCTCCSDLPVVRQPVLIYPWMPLNNVFNAPSNWNPEVMDTANLKMDLSGASNPNLNNMGSNPYA